VAAIPGSLRQEVPSLVWVAVAAQFLARAWVRQIVSVRQVVLARSWVSQVEVASLAV